MLVCSRTPFRVSFFGGGTDYPEYFERRKGSVVGMAINKYVYVSVLPLSNLIDYKYRVSYSKLETCQTISEIAHPAVRAILDYFDLPGGLDISISANLPARSGMGSSSSFTVGMLNVILKMLDKNITRYDLGKLAIHVERGLLCERVGVQDQLHAAFGGLNRFDFEGNRYRISPVQITSDCLNALNSSLYLVYTGIIRHASEVLDEQMKATSDQTIDRDLGHLLKLVDDSVTVFESNDPDRMLTDLGLLLHDGWMTKKKLSSKISMPEIDQLYEDALSAGAIGGKLCGAGGGGFLLMLVPPGKKAQFEEKMKKTPVIKIEMDAHGSVIM